MKKKTTFKIVMLTMLTAISLSACKKDKTKESEPQPVEVKTITITELRALSTGASLKLPDGRKVKGIVISDVTAKNIDSKTVILQEAADKPGIIATFDAAQTFAVGDEVELTISNQTLAQVNGEIVLQNLPAANAKKAGTGSISPKATTITEVQANKAAWNGTLVSITATELSSADGKYKGNLTVKDASGTISSAVASGAAFENTALPVSVSKITGILRLSGTDIRIDVRNATDVTSGSVSEIVSVDLENQIGLNAGFGVKGITAPPVDISFTNASAKYLYLLANGIPQPDVVQINIPTQVVKVALKEITVTFAGSKMSGDYPYDLQQSLFSGYDGSEFELSPFDAAIDYFQIELGAINGGSHFTLKSSEVFKEAGKFFKVTFKAPTAAELTASGVNPDEFVEYPAYSIKNISKRKNVSKQYYMTNAAPIVVEKIELKY